MNILEKYSKALNEDIDSRLVEVSMEGYSLVAECETEKDEKKERSASSRCHTLFAMESKNEAGEPYTKYRLFLGPIMDMFTELNPIMNPLLNAGKQDTLEVRIASGGGFVTVGYQLINVMENVFSGRTETVIDCTAGSMASAVFINGNKRTIYKYSSLMIHDFSGWFMGKSGEAGPKYEHSNDTFNNHFYNEMVKTGFITIEEFNRLKDGKDYYFGPEELLMRGMATHIILKGVEYSAKAGLEIINESIVEDYL